MRSRARPLISRPSGGHGYRVDASGMRTRVTTRVIVQANGVAFYNGSLYVDGYGRGVLYTLSACRR